MHWALVVGTVALLGAGGFGAWWLLRDGSGTPVTSTTALTAPSTTGEAVVTTTTWSLGSSVPGASLAGQNGPIPAGWVLDGDQAAVAERFGLPSVFTIVFGQDLLDVLPDAPVHRFEVWDYHDMGVRFIFRDGAVTGTRTIDMLGPEYDYPAVAPAWFVEGMDVDDVVAVMGAEPTSGGVLLPAEGEDFVLLLWYDVVAVSFLDGVIASVETAPVEVRP